jgi:hypothetical protein
MRSDRCYVLQQQAINGAERRQAIMSSHLPRRHVQWRDTRPAPGRVEATSGQRPLHLIHWSTATAHAYAAAVYHIQLARIRPCRRPAWPQTRSGLRRTARRWGSRPHPRAPTESSAALPGARAHPLPAHPHDGSSPAVAARNRTRASAVSRRTMAAPTDHRRRQAPHRV